MSYFGLVDIWDDILATSILFTIDPQKRSGTVYIYIIFRIYSGIKTFRPFIGAFHVFLRKHVPEKLIVVQSVSVST